MHADLVVALLRRVFSTDHARDVYRGVEADDWTDRLSQVRSDVDCVVAQIRRCGSG